MAPRDGIAAALVVVLVLVVVALAALPWAALALVARQSSRYPCLPAGRVKVSEAYDALRTGDLLLFVGAAHNIVSAAATQEYFSHGAFVLREGDLVYTSEASMGAHLCAAPGHPGPRHHSLAPGAALAPLLPRVKNYNGLCFLLRLEGAGLGAAREAAVKAEADRLAAAAHPYPTPLQAAAALLGWPVKARHCFQHVAHLLEVAGLASGLGEAGLLGACREVCGISGKELAGGRRYSPPLLLVYDIG